ncbi:MAG TPA: enoyl-CoA hydratase [Nitrospiria bacterium]|nr:enoyl-CoA hydratase [Nitrospiria bacterium]
MGNQFVNVNQDEHVATVTLNNPPANALSSPLMAELGGVLDELAENASVKAVVVAGSGTIFVAGADIKEIATISASKQGEELTSKGQAIFNKMERLSKPTIAAINGFCLGGGLELAMACHLRICGDRARLGQPEINLGIIPGFGGTQRLSRLVGRAKALEMILTGDIINAQEAKSLGLVNKVVPEGEVLKQALGLAKKITSKGGKALSAALRAVQEGFSRPLEEGLALESRLFGTLCETADMKEGISAFLEKRQPKFSDQ